MEKRAADIQRYVNKYFKKKKKMPGDGRTG